MSLKSRLGLVCLPPVVKTHANQVGVGDMCATKVITILKRRILVTHQVFGCARSRVRVVERSKINRSFCWGFDIQVTSCLVHLRERCPRGLVCWLGES